MGKKAQFEQGAVVVIPKASVRRYSPRMLNTPGIIADVYYSKNSEGFVYEVQYTDVPHYEFVREDDLRLRDPKGQ